MTHVTIRFRNGLEAISREAGVERQDPPPSGLARVCLVLFMGNM